jgi:hypothetical protein
MLRSAKLKSIFRFFCFLLTFFHFFFAFSAFFHCFSLNFRFASIFSLTFRFFYLRFRFRFLVFRIEVNHVKSGFFFASKRNEIFASISNFASEVKVRAHPNYNTIPNQLAPKDQRVGGKETGTNLVCRVRYSYSLQAKNRGFFCLEAKK